MSGATPPLDLQAIRDRWEAALDAKPSKGPITKVDALWDSACDVPALLAALAAATAPPAVESDPYARLKELHPAWETEPIIRHARTSDGAYILDEVVAIGADVHLERMNRAQWWMSLKIKGRTWTVNLGAVDGTVEDYAQIEED